MKTKPDETAFPIVYNEDNHVKGGLTKREYFAAMAMQAIVSNSSVDFDENATYCTPAKRSQQAVKMADALIEQLNKEGE